MTATAPPHTAEALADAINATVDVALTLTEFGPAEPLPITALRRLREALITALASVRLIELAIAIKEED